MGKLFRIGLAWHTSWRSRELGIRGMAEYANRYGPWQFSLNQIEDFDVRHNPEPLHFDGIIVSYDDTDRVNSIHWPRKIPIVALQRTDDRVTPWRVLPDDEAVGRLVAEEFIKRGFRRLAYFPQKDLKAPGTPWDNERLEGFDRIARTYRVQTRVYEGPVGVWGQLNHKAHSVPLADWLLSLVKPVGIMAASDMCARHLLLAAEAVGVRIPEVAAVISVDNEPWAEIIFRGLSSVELDGARSGYAAAELLHKLLEKQPITPTTIRIPPRRLIVRRSSSTTAIDDSDVANAVRFINEHATNGIGVRHVVDAVPLSRRTLERRFHDALHHSILQEIRAVQVQRAKLLLVDETIPLPTVAKVSGFSSVKAMQNLFRRMVGITPTKYRKTSLEPRQFTRE
jgi:LacI family transcriptional regulator